MAQARERGGRMLNRDLFEASGNGKPVDWGSSGDIPNDDLYMRAANLRRNVTTRAKVENRQRSQAGSVLPPAVAQVSVTNVELL